MQYFNCHTHTRPVAPQTAIRSLHKNFYEVNQPGYFSIGLHPWYIDDNWHEPLAQLGQFAEHKQVVALGECGLDKACATSFNLQQQVFERQVNLANDCNKPLVIHCVKAYDEVLQLLKQATVPAVFHGFTKSRQLAERLVDAGFYLSFGKALQQPRMQHVLAALPVKRIFLETDDAAVSIADVYKWAAYAFSIDVDLLSLQLKQNALTVFNINT